MDTMTRKNDDDWMSVRIEKGLAFEIDKLISSPKSSLFGSRKYTSRGRFVKEAIIRLLEEETAKQQQNGNGKRAMITAEARSKR